MSTDEQQREGRLLPFEYRKRPVKPASEAPRDPRDPFTGPGGALRITVRVERPGPFDDDER